MTHSSPTRRSSDLPARLRRTRGRARGEAVRRPAPAHRHRPRAAQERADPGAGRGHLGAGFGGRGGDPGEPVPADARQDGDRHRPPALDHRGNGPAGGDGCRAHRRTGHARTAAGARRPVRAAVATAVRWLPGARCRDRRRRLTMPPARAIAHTAGVSSEDAVMRVVTLLLATGLLAACASQPMDPTADLPPDAVPTTRTEANGDVITEYREIARDHD